MKSAEITKGKWKAVKTVNSDNRITWDINAETPKGFTFLAEFAVKEDAIIAAAAPELLQACWKALDVIIHRQDGTPRDRAINKFDKAIAKAIRRTIAIREE